MNKFLRIEDLLSFSSVYSIIEGHSGSTISAITRPVAHRPDEAPRSPLSQETHRQVEVSVPVARATRYTQHSRV
jgi:hypothetical protein